MRNGEVVNCFKMNLADGRVAEIAGMCGYDCIWVDVEHVANDLNVVENCIWAAKTHDVDVLVRVARGSYSDYIRPLELDASGIMVPHLISVADAKDVVRMTRFMPIGRRPIDGGNADGSYCGVSTKDYIKSANEQRFVIVQIEDPEAMEDLDAIAQVPGIDMLFFGPGDFSHAIGAAGEVNHPKVVDARLKVAAAAIKHGKFAGTVTGPDREQIEDLKKLGYRFLALGADVLALMQYCRTCVDLFMP